MKIFSKRKLFKPFVVSLVGLGFIFFSGQLLAQEDSDDGKKRTTIDFEDELIQGESANSELFYLLQKKQFNYKRLIRLRENFLPEMRDTAESVEQGGGQM